MLAIIAIVINTHQPSHLSFIAIITYCIVKSSNRQIVKLLNRQIVKSSNRQLSQLLPITIIKSSAIAIIGYCNLQIFKPKLSYIARIVLILPFSAHRLRLDPLVTSPFSHYQFDHRHHLSKSCPCHPYASFLEALIRYVLSFYKYLEGKINAAWTNLEADTLEPSAYAKTVVSKVARATPPDTIWCGSGAFTVWAIETLGAHWLYPLAFSKMFGLNEDAPQRKLE